MAAVSSLFVAGPLARQCNANGEMELPEKSRRRDKAGALRLVRSGRVQARLSSRRIFRIQDYSYPTTNTRPCALPGWATGTTRLQKFK